MKTSVRIFSLFLVFCTIFVFFTGCAEKSAVEITLKDLNLSIQPDTSIPQLPGDKSELLLSNIDRGFRLETYYTLGSGRAWPTDEGSDGYKMLEEEIEFYKDDCANEIQVYIYLNEYYNKPLDEFALNQLKAYFMEIRRLRMSMLLRFAYDYDQPSEISPSQDVLLGHLAQLKGFISENEALINDTVTAYQFGVVGAWGEWGATNQKYNERKILDALIDMFPEGTYFQGRYMRVTKQTNKNPRAEYVGYHNDFLVGRPHPWNTAGDLYESRNYKVFSENAPYRMNDGEMPWGGHSDEPDEVINGINFLKQMREHCMGTLSIKHNYIENKSGTEGEQHNLYRWKSEMVTPELLKENKLPYYDGWFKNADGDTIERSVYAYLRDYLGYLLVLSNLEIKETNGKTNLTVTLTNYGFGAPLTLDGMELVLRDKASGEEETISLLDFDVKQLTTYNQQTFTVEFDADASTKDIGIKLFRRCSTGDYTIRTANDIPYENGVNYIKY